MPQLRFTVSHPVSAFLRCLMVVAIAIGLLLPRMSAVLAEIVPGVQTVVICTGFEITTLTLAPDGTPIETDAQVSPHCTLADIVDPSPTGDAQWVALNVTQAKPPAIQLHPAADQDRLNRLRLSRAPPLLS